MSRRRGRSAAAALLLAAALLAATGAAAGAPEAAAGSGAVDAWVDPATLTFPEVRWLPPSPKRVTLRTGATLHLLEDHELPKVAITLYARGGRLHDPPERTGLSAAAAAVLRTGGSATTAGDDLDEELEFLGAAIESFDGGEYQIVSAGCLSRDLPRVIALLGELIRHPAFPEEKLGLWKAQTVEGIRRRWDTPGSIAAIYFQQALYGADSPYARLATEATVGAVSRDDLRALHAGRFVGSNLVLTAVGDFKEADLVARLEEALRGLPRGRAADAAPSKVEDRVRRRVIHIERPIPQATIRMGHLGANRLAPDRFPLMLMNYVLGSGGFSSRLTKAIRVERGLAYSAFGSVTTGPDRGVFGVGLETKSASVVPAIRAAREIVAAMREAPVTEAELAEARNYEINSFAFWFPTTEAAVAQQVASLLEGLPRDYWTTYVEKIRAVTREDVLKAARKYLDPDRMTLVTVGTRAEFGGDLSEFGPVEEKVTPRPATEAPPPPGGGGQAPTPEAPTPEPAPDR